MTNKLASKGTKGSKAAGTSTKKSAQAPAPGSVVWTSVCCTFQVQKPDNVPEFERYCILDGVYHLWVKSNDKPYSPGSETQPRTERRFNLDGQQDYTSGQWQYEADMMVPSGSNGMSIMQIHTTDKFTPSTAFMLWWSSANGGSVSHYSKPTLASNLWG
ncbi:MAG TPA: polysaccharide lyase family 7 protein, partial [Pyrinomonadaceae bacterium]|nr:polysaccharide lyase family 7 protein [Pyrinomonadaceae bacterium]